MFIRFAAVFCYLKLMIFVRKLIRIPFIIQLFVLVTFYCLNHKTEYKHPLLFPSRIRWIARIVERHSCLKFWNVLHWDGIVLHVEGGQVDGTKINVYLARITWIKMAELNWILIPIFIGIFSILLWLPITAVIVLIVYNNSQKNSF